MNRGFDEFYEQVEKWAEKHNWGCILPTTGQVYGVEGSVMYGRAYISPKHNTKGYIEHLEGEEWGYRAAPITNVTFTLRGYPTQHKGTMGVHWHEYMKVRVGGKTLTYRRYYNILNGAVAPNYQTAVHALTHYLHSLPHTQHGYTLTHAPFVFYTSTNGTLNILFYPYQHTSKAKV